VLPPTYAGGNDSLYCLVLTSKYSYVILVWLLLAKFSGPEQHAATLIRKGGGDAVGHERLVESAAEGHFWVREGFLV
jgi:hypothetical protein